MRKREWSLVIGLIFLVWILDRITKIWAVSSIVGFKFYGPVGFVLHKNPGAMLGMFSDLPPILRIVSLSTGGTFLIFIYIFIQYLIPKKSLSIRSGMSILLGGILGNVSDRIIGGAVVDFLVIGSKEMATPAFNLADALQWVGYALIVYTLITEGDQIWPSSNERKGIWVKPKFQAKYIFILIAIGAGFSIIGGVFSYTYIKVIIDDLVVGQSQAIEYKFTVPFLITFSIISLAFTISLLIIGRILSHRTAGPMHAFEKYLEDILKGKDRSLKLRIGDEFSHLEELAEKLKTQLKTNFTKNITDETDEEDSK